MSWLNLPSWAWPAIIAGGLVIAGGVWWFFFRKSPSSVAASQAPPSQTPTRVMEYWYKPGCPPCEAFKPVWATFKSTYGSAIQIEEFSTIEDRERAIQRGIEGTPTVMMVYADGTTDMYKGERTVDAIAAWAGLTKE